MAVLTCESPTHRFETHLVALDDSSMLATLHGWARDHARLFETIRTTPSSSSWSASTGPARSRSDGSHADRPRPPGRPLLFLATSWRARPGFSSVLAAGRVTIPVSPSSCSATPTTRPASGTLRRHGVPRLLVVSPPHLPPICADPLEDWVWGSAEPADIDARVEALEQRSQRPAAAPRLDEDGLPPLPRPSWPSPRRSRSSSAALLADFGEVVGPRRADPGRLDPRAGAGAHPRHPHDAPAAPPRRRRAHRPHDPGPRLAPRVPRPRAARREPLSLV